MASFASDSYYPRGKGSLADVIPNGITALPKGHRDRRNTDPPPLKT